MATRFDATLQMSNSTDALFRQWAKFIHDLLITTGGWVDPGDTGQMDFTTVTRPLAANTFMGYRMYRMADALQATAPVYVKFEYGSGTLAASPAIRVTIGTGTNGTGTITGALITNAIFSSGSTSAVAVCDSFGSADTNRAHVLMFSRAGQNDIYAWSIERTKDAAGADTATGLILIYGGAEANTQSVSRCAYVRFVGGAQPPIEVGLSLVISNQVSSVFGGDLGVGVIIPMMGVAQQPGIGLIAVNSGDFVSGAQPTIGPIYGANHVYQLGRGVNAQIRVASGNAGTTERVSTCVGIRYE